MAARDPGTRSAAPQAVRTPSQHSRLLCMQGRTSESDAATLHGALALARRARVDMGEPVVSVGSAGEFAAARFEADAASAAAPLRALAESLPTTPPVALFGGHCAIALATVPKLTAGTDARLLWLDAHGDFNTPDTTESGFLGGMVLSALVDRWRAPIGVELGSFPEDRVVLAGVNALDPPEADLLDSSAVAVLAADEFDGRTLMCALDEAPVFVHLDLDVVDPRILPPEYPTGCGLTPSDVGEALTQATRGRRLIGFEVTGLRGGDDALVELAWPAVAPLVEALLIESARA
jgi:arginase